MNRVHFATLLLVLCGTSLSPFARSQGSAGAPVSKPVDGFESAGIDGHSLRYMCKGTGSPTVIVEQGGGISMETVFSWSPPVGWAAILPIIAKETRMCVYDRADLGRSSKSAGMRTAREAARDLHALLAKIGVQPPYVIAGQSLGGINARMYAHEYPSEIAGLILIDTSHPDWYAQLAKVLPPPAENESEVLRGYRYGPPASILGERIDIPASLTALQTAGDLGDKPLVILTRSPGSQGGGPIPDEWQRRSDALHQQLQPDLAKLSTNGRHIVAKKAGHNIQLEEPKLVIDAILEVVRQARERKN
jgi:pimeloyl-ACP methyl ester carboxylesterase